GRRGFSVYLGALLAACHACCRMRTWKHKHGGSTLKEYSIWWQMVRRCTWPKHQMYSAYGGRGIKVCERWFNNFGNFYAEMGPRPAGCSLDRIDNDGHYEPSNCRWATRKQQNDNKQQTRWLTFNGKTQTLMAWAKELGLPPNSLRNRINDGWDVERALTTPIQ